LFRILTGALTSRIYAFESRKWELQSIDTCDIYDPLVNTIRVEVLGLRTIRILPKLRQGVNEEWVSDKTRYCFDGIYNKRLNMPTLKTIKKEYHILEWHEMLRAIMHKVEKHKNTCAYIAGGELDGESILMLREMSKKYGREKKRDSNDIKIYYISDILNITKLDYLLLLNINLRRENPVLDFIMREKLKEVRLGIWDEVNNISCAIGMGNCMQNMVRVLEGKADICKLIKRSYLGNLMICNEEKRSKTFCRILEECGKCQSLVLPRLSGYMLNYELGGVGLNYECKTGLIYSLGEDDIDMGNVVYLVYQGHSGDRMVKVSDMMLPSSEFIEKEGLYMSIFGEVYGTKFVFEPPGLVRGDWKILSSMQMVLSNKVEYNLSTLSFIRKRMYEISPGIFTRRYIFSSLKLMLEDVEKNINYFYSEYIATPFKSGTITRVSETLKSLGRRENHLYYHPKG
jgi:NADH dehydrogenase/NADH:ubiquinone oxidoreductase subunit G